MITIDDVKKAWANYEAYKDRAEQHEFTMLLMLDMKLVPLYNDLIKNWDESHAEIFMNFLKNVGEKFGFTLC